MIRSRLPVPIGSCLAEIPKTLFTIAKRVFCPFSIFDIGTGTVPSDNVSCFVTEGSSPNQKTAILPVGPTNPCLILIRRTRRDSFQELVHKLGAIVGMNR